MCCTESKLLATRPVWDGNSVTVLLVLFFSALHVGLLGMKVESNLLLFLPSFHTEKSQIQTTENKNRKKQPRKNHRTQPAENKTAETTTEKSTTLKTTATITEGRTAGPRVHPRAPLHFPPTACHRCFLRPNNISPTAMSLCMSSACVCICACMHVCMSVCTSACLHVCTSACCLHLKGGDCSK